MCCVCVHARTCRWIAGQFWGSWFSGDCHHVGPGDEFRPSGPGQEAQRSRKIMPAYFRDQLAVYSFHFLSFVIALPNSPFNSDAHSKSRRTQSLPFLTYDDPWRTLRPLSKLEWFYQWRSITFCLKAFLDPFDYHLLSFVLLTLINWFFNEGKIIHNEVIFFHWKIFIFH